MIVFSEPFENFFSLVQNEGGGLINPTVGSLNMSTKIVK